MSSNRPPKVLVAKAGLDGHDRGVKIVARALRDAGVEVVYLGLHNTPAEIVNAAIQEDVDAVGLSILSAAHLTLFDEVLRGLRAHRAGDIVVFGGGIIPDDDLPRLRKMGVSAVFQPGTPLESIVEFVRGGLKTHAPSQRQGAKALKRRSA
jgi:methylmalonyl-CoA mutase C-terminal domain/subunit